MFTSNGCLCSAVSFGTTSHNWTLSDVTSPSSGLVVEVEGRVRDRCSSGPPSRRNGDLNVPIDHVVDGVEAVAGAAAMPARPSTPKPCDRRTPHPARGCRRSVMMIEVVGLLGAAAPLAPAATRLPARRIGRPVVRPATRPDRARSARRPAGTRSAHRANGPLPYRPSRRRLHVVDGRLRGEAPRERDVIEPGPRDVAEVAPRAPGRPRCRARGGRRLLRRVVDVRRTATCTGVALAVDGSGR